MENSQVKSSHQRERIYLSLTLLPIVILLVTLIIGFARELACAAEYRAIIRDLKVAGEPTDLRSGFSSGLASNSSSVQLKSRKIANAVAHLENQSAAIERKIISSAVSLDVQIAMDLRNEESLRLRKDAQPLFESSASRSIQTAHALFNLACRIDDSQIAMKIMETLERPYPLLYESAYHIWTDEQLPVILNMANEKRVSTDDWGQAYRGIRSQYLSRSQFNTRNRLEPFGVAPSLKLARLKYLEDLGNADIRSTKETRSALAGNRLETSSLVSVPFAVSNLRSFDEGKTVEMQVKSRFISEMTDRLYLTAIAIRLFNSREDRMPNSLDELTKVGLSNADWKIVDNHDFGYRVDINGTATLWSGGVHDLDSKPWYSQEFTTPSLPPSEAYPGRSTFGLEYVIY